MRAFCQDPHETASQKTFTGIYDETAARGRASGKEGITERSGERDLHAFSPSSGRAEDSLLYRNLAACMMDRTARPVQ